MKTRKGAGLGYKTLTRAVIAASALWAVTGLHADTLWHNGDVTGVANSHYRCDAGPNMCGNTMGTSWTVFDNFTVPAGPGFVINRIDFTDYVFSFNSADYKNTTWSIWNGDPLDPVNPGKIVKFGTVAADPAAMAPYTCGSLTCVNFHLNLPTAVVLGAGTYYLGLSNFITPPTGNPNGEETDRAITSNAPLSSKGRWEQSNGSLNSGTGGWDSGTANYIFPQTGFGTLNIQETSTAFDLQGTLVPEPGTIVLMSFALAGLGYAVRRRRQAAV